MRLLIHQAFEFTGASLYTFIYPNEYIVLLEAEKFQKYLHIFETLGEKQSPIIKIGVGNVEALSQQHISYQSSKIAINSLLVNESLAIFDALDLEILLGNISEDNKKFFLQKTLSSIVTHLYLDKPNPLFRDWNIKLWV